MITMIILAGWGVIAAGIVIIVLVRAAITRQQRQAEARAWAEHIATAHAVSRPGVTRLPPEPEEDIDEVLRQWVREGRGK